MVKFHKLRKVSAYVELSVYDYIHN